MYDDDSEDGLEYDRLPPELQDEVDEMIRTGDAVALGVIEGGASASHVSIPQEWRDTRAARQKSMTRHYVLRIGLVLFCVACATVAMIRHC